MSRWTDKKRGEIGNRGNLGSHINSMSFNRHQQETLGNLFQTQKYRKTPDGEITVSAFGMYEKFRFNPIVKEEKLEPVKERLVLLLQGYDNQDEIIAMLQLIEIKKDGNYEVVESVLVPMADIYNNYIMTASWDYEKNCFLIFGYDWNWLPLQADNFLSEVSTTGIVTPKALYRNYSEEALTFHVSYGEEGKQRRMWLGSEYYVLDNINYTLLELNTTYGFGNYPVASPDTLIPIYNSDMELFYDPTIYNPTLIYYTYDNVRILKTENDWGNGQGFGGYNFFYGEGCRVKNKIAYIYRPKYPYVYSYAVPDEIRCCNDRYLSHSLGDEKRYTPASYLEDYNTVIQSDIINYGSAVSNAWYHAYVYWVASNVGSYVSHEKILDYPFDDYINGWKVVTTNCPPATPAVMFKYNGWGNEDDDACTVMDINVTEATTLTVKDPAGVDHQIPIADPFDRVWTSLIIVWLFYVSSTANVEADPIQDLTYINNHYVWLSGYGGEAIESNRTPFRLHISDNNGVEKGLIPMESGQIVELLTGDYRFLERVLVKG